ncbi:Quinolinate synthase A [bioreactor metagenome]|uniref:quinolinate synthase n=1 Tax=bioreactor metagenome TaxID=1076179 RepID=A0A644YDD2_9ZZZZ|nr:quinolinate synthase NadA [Oscillospiraceae bacterium]
MATASAPAANVGELQRKIKELKLKKDICILAHTYQAREICEIADFTGDSYQLSVKASKVQNKTVVMCGVRFMAETVKILSPEKRVILANSGAACPMAEQFDVKTVEEFKRCNPGYTVVAYINTTAALKAVCDVCVTSSSAVKIVKNISNKNILFIPDCNLGDYVTKQCPEKNIKLLSGGCPIHASVLPEEVDTAKNAHPNALVLVHPECVPEVVAKADYVGSTAGIIDFAKESEAKEFIIGTELAVAEHLQYDAPGKKFYPLSKKLICLDMKLTTLVDVFDALNGEGEEISLDPKTIADAGRCIDEMIRLGSKSK